MSKLKIAVIGAGSSYTAEIIEKLAEFREKLPAGEIALMDVDETRLSIIEGYCKRAVKHLGYDVKITATTDRARAVDGADFIDVQLRVGGNKARVNDEKIPMKYGLIGQETTGAGGMMKAFRTIPVLLGLADDVEKYSPDGWIINYTNPTGLVTEAVTKYKKTKIAGLCSGGYFPRQHVANLLNVPGESVYYDYVGLNHLNFAYNFTVDGRALTDAEFDKMAEKFDAIGVDLIKTLRLIPIGYLGYYFNTAKNFKHMSEAPTTRGENVQELEKSIFAEYADETLIGKPPSLTKRGGGGYSDVAIGVMDAIHNNANRWIVVNVPNQGILKFLPDDAVIEAPCIVNNAGIRPIAVKDMPNTVWGLISAVKNYEQLAVEAAVKGDKDLAMLALLAHPLVRDYDVVKPLLHDLLEANKPYLPQFNR